MHGFVTLQCTYQSYADRQHLNPSQPPARLLKPCTVPQTESWPVAHPWCGLARSERPRRETRDG
eukprot:49019-Eustigmatos_ZCMA.PRE.1